MEGEKSERLLGPQWEGPDWRFKFGNHGHRKLNKTLHQSCNLSCVCGNFSQEKKISLLKGYGNYYLLLALFVLFDYQSIGITTSLLSAN